MKNRNARVFVIGTLGFLTFLAASPGLVRADESADARVARWDRGTGKYMIQAVGNVMDSAKAAGDMSDFGYAEGTCFLGAYLDRGNSVAYEPTLTAGTKYLFLVGGDNDVTDLAIDIAISDGPQVASRRPIGPSVSLEFTPNRTRKYTITVRLHGADARGSFVGMAILCHNGYSVPVKNLVSAATRMIAACRGAEVGAAKYGADVNFNASSNQWSVFGAVLKSNESAAIIHMHPGDGSQFFLAVGDEAAHRLSLAVTDNEGTRTLQDSTNDRDVSIVSMTTQAGEGYGFKTTADRTDNDRPCLVLTAVLTMHS